MKSAEIEASAFLRWPRRRIARRAVGYVLAALIIFPLAGRASAQTLVGCRDGSGNVSMANCATTSPGYAPAYGGANAAAYGFGAAIVNKLLSGPSPAEIQRQQRKLQFQREFQREQGTARRWREQTTNEREQEEQAEKDHQQETFEKSKARTLQSLREISDGASDSEITPKTGDAAMADPSTPEQSGPCPLDANGMPECGAPVGESMPNASANALQQYKKYDPSAVPAPPSPPTAAGDTAQPGWKQTLTQSQWKSLTPAQQRHLKAQWRADGKLSRQTQQQDQQVEKQTRAAAKEGLDAVKGAAKGAVEDSDYGGPAVGASVGALKSVLKDETAQRLGQDLPEGALPNGEVQGVDVPGRRGD